MESFLILFTQPVFALQLIIDGLLIGAIFALAAYGMALVWGVIVLALVSAHAIDRWWAYLLAAVVISSRQCALANLAHDAWHRLCFRSVRWND